MSTPLERAVYEMAHKRNGQDISILDLRPFAVPCLNRLDKETLAPLGYSEWAVRKAMGA